jgi:hypothetical protein
LENSLLKKYIKIDAKSSIGVLQEKYRVKECLSGLYLLYHSASEKVSFLTTQSAHKHDNNTKLSSRVLSLAVKCIKKNIKKSFKKNKGHIRHYEIKKCCGTSEVKINPLTYYFFKD